MSEAMAGQEEPFKPGQRIYIRWLGKVGTVLWPRLKGELVGPRWHLYVKEDDGFVSWVNQDERVVAVSEEMYPFEIWSDPELGRWRYRFDQETWDLRSGKYVDALLPWSVDREEWLSTAHYMVADLLQPRTEGQPPSLKGPPSWFSQDKVGKISDYALGLRRKEAMDYKRGFKPPPEELARPPPAPAPPAPPTPEIPGIIERLKEEKARAVVPLHQSWEVFQAELARDLKELAEAMYKELDFEQLWDALDQDTARRLWEEMNRIKALDEDVRKEIRKFTRSICQQALAQKWEMHPPEAYQPRTEAPPAPPTPPPAEIPTERAERHPVLKWRGIPPEQHKFLVNLLGPSLARLQGLARAYGDSRRWTPPDELRQDVETALSNLAKLLLPKLDWHEEYVVDEAGRGIFLEEDFVRMLRSRFLDGEKVWELEFKVPRKADARS